MTGSAGLNSYDDLCKAAAESPQNPYGFILQAMKAFVCESVADTEEEGTPTPQLFKNIVAVIEKNEPHPLLTLFDEYAGIVEDIVATSFNPEERTLEEFVRRKVVEQTIVLTTEAGNSTMFD